MSEGRGRGRRGGFAPRFRWVLAAAALTAISALALAAWNSTRVSWAEVRQAYGRQKTINGLGRITGAAGREYKCSLWVQVVGPDKFTRNVMLIPVKGKPSARLDADRLELIGWLDYTGGPNHISTLAARRSVERGRRTEWGGRPALEVTISMRLEALSQQAGQPAEGPDRLRFYLDPETRLIRAQEVFKGGKLRAAVEYYYNRPLPKGFKPQ